MNRWDLADLAERDMIDRADDVLLREAFAVDPDCGLAITGPECPTCGDGRRMWAEHPDRFDCCPHYDLGDRDGDPF